MSVTSFRALFPSPSKGENLLLHSWMFSKAYDRIGMGYESGSKSDGRLGMTNLDTNFSKYVGFVFRI